MTEVYLDMDGVLADFCSEYFNVAGLSRMPCSEIPPAKKDPILQRLIGTDFFARLHKYPDADAIVSLTVKLFGHYNICSSPLRNDEENSKKYKTLWITKNLTPAPKTVIITSKKSTYAKGPDGTPNILIDDKEKNIQEWVQKGGVGIHYDAEVDSLSLLVSELHSFVSQAKDSDVGESASVGGIGASAVATGGGELFGGTSKMKVMRRS